jgi:hypothetical protein
MNNLYRTDDNGGPRHRPNTERRVMPGLSGVAGAGATPFIALAEGFRYHGIRIDYAATTLALTAVTTDVMINGKAEQHFTWDQRDSWNQHDKLPAAAANTGTMYIPFERIGLLDERERYSTCINYGENSKGPQAPGGVNDFRLNLAFDGTPVGITKFDVYAVTSGINPEQSIYINKIEQWSETIAASAGGTDNVLQRRLVLKEDKTRMYLTRMWANDTAAHLTKLRIEENGVPVHEAIPTALTNAEAQSLGIRSPQANWQFWDGAMLGESDRWIELQAASLKTVLTATTGATTPVTIVTECLGSTAG